MMRLKLTVLMLAASLGAQSALADQVAVPDGCTALATIQKSSCHATTIVDCGASREAHTYQNGTARVIHVYSPTWQMTEFRFADIEGARMTSVPGTVANTRLDQLLASGESEEAGQFVMNTGMIKDRVYILSGQIKGNGNTVELGGDAYHTAKMYRIFELKPGAGGMEFEIDLYYSPERDVLIEGDWTRSVFGSEKELFDQTPYDVSWPGEDGFLATRSEKGCE